MLNKHPDGQLTSSLDLPAVHAHRFVGLWYDTEMYSCINVKRLLHFNIRSKKKVLTYYDWMFSWLRQKSQGLHRDFFYALGQMTSARCAVSALPLTFEGWSYFKETPVPLAGPPHTTVQQLP